MRPVHEWKQRVLAVVIGVVFGAENLVFTTKIENPEQVDRDILYSILDKDPKRAEAYWFLNINVVDEPYTAEYHVETYGTD